MTPEDSRPANIEPSVAQVEAFKTAWEAEDDRQIQKLAAGPYMPNPGDRTRAGLRAALALEAGQKTYPFIDGPHLVIGPECFTGDGDEVSQDVISWRGENFYLQERTARLVLEWLQPVLPENWARDCAKQFGVDDLYIAEPGPKPDLS